MEIKLFKLQTCVSPEWGATYDHQTFYFISDEVEKVLQKIYEDYGWGLDGSNGKWVYSRYYGMDREELSVVLEEIECVNLIQE